ncbi:amidase family protein [Cupriavidus sp. WKF15]|uniref:amidase family protein n=1 Tax=Cupriavidus sp. WKF15 TaxID=3032282 RepID=UPI0023E2C685|nr:amidase family protein [Cupriavidus sp. WKF15]WER50784.1 amidase family protein [Cupriavidus sp. WKF15]
MSNIHQTRSDLCDLSLAAAAQAIATGTLSATDYATALLQNARLHVDLKAFITLDEDYVLEAAHKADLERQAGIMRGLLHGVPIAVKDSINTQDLPTSIGTSVLANFRPAEDAVVVKAMRSAGAIVFGKSNLVEMSYGLTGLNAHYGQVKNPYDLERITGGSSSGAGAAVAARIVPAALGGDTVGSIRVPSSLCGVVGFRPSTGRWPAAGVAPISDTLDTAGPMARTVEDCAILDAIATGEVWHPRAPAAGLKGLRFGYAPKQHLDLVDSDVESCFSRALAALKEAGAEIVEVDMGADFHALAFKANWPIFARETRPSVTGFLAVHGTAATFEEIYEGLGTGIKSVWANSVLLDAPGSVSVQDYYASVNLHRPALQQRFAQVYREYWLDGLIFPTTPTVAPPIASHAQFDVAGHAANRITLARNTFPGSCAGLPGISIPIGLSPAGLPIGMEIDGTRNGDVALLEAAARIFGVLGPIAAPNPA